MSRIAADERRQLCDLLDELGPAADTLCEGWATRDLAAHLVLRERSPSMVGIRLKPFAGWTRHTQEQLARHPYAALVEQVRTGPPIWSPFALPPVDAAVNTTEYFVHHEDARRAQDGWEPRDLHPKVEDALWRIVKGWARITFRSAPTGVELVRETGDRLVGKRGEPVVTITGRPQEVLLYIMGRKSHARVELTGDAEAVHALRGEDLAV